MAEFIRLDRLYRHLQYIGYDQLGLKNLDRLRNEIHFRMEQMKLEEKKKPSKDINNPD